jgi:hypothetical protein
MTVGTPASDRELVLTRLIEARAKNWFGRGPSPSF